MWRWIVSPVEPEEPNTAHEANRLQGDATLDLGGTAEPNPAQDPRRSPADTTLGSKPRAEGDDPAKPSEVFARTTPVEPVAATRSFEPVTATRSFESYEPYECHEPDQAGNLNKPTWPMPQDDLRQHESRVNPVSRSTGQRPSGPKLAPDATSIAAGLVFFILGGAYLLASSGHLTVNAAWTVSLLFIGLGLSGFLGVALNSRRRR
jgi:hypothetical protein